MGVRGALAQLAIAQGGGDVNIKLKLAVKPKAEG